jgi:hypothetical protein
MFRKRSKRRKDCFTVLPNSLAFQVELKKEGKIFGKGEFYVED